MHAATVWLLDSRSVGVVSDAWLGATERRRLAGFIRSERRRQFVLGRVLLRCALAPLLGIVPADISLIERHAQAPLLDLPDRHLPGFSLSHSGPWIACAVSAHTQVGLDIERLDATRDIDALAAQVCDAGQQAMLAGLAPAERIAAFYTIWSTAEARCKLGTPAAYDAVLAHPALSIVVCSAQPLAAAPVLLDGAPLLASSPQRIFDGQE
jgi:4'-phosphopantetheinyl transferase